MPADPLANEILRRNEQLTGERAPWMSLWQSLADYIQPRKNQITRKQTRPDSDDLADLFDTTAVDANLVLGAGQLQYITPASERWAAFDAPASLQKKPGGLSGDGARWFQNCSDVVMRELARSNFYTEVHEFYLDRGGMGTACLYVEQGKRTTFNCCCHPIGTYAIGEDDEGYVDTVFREFQLTNRQAAQKFGPENLSPKVKKAFLDPKAGKLDEKHTYIHAVYPRAEDKREAGKRDGKNKPIASIYVDKGEKWLISNQGYDENPYMVTRYLTWGDNVWGYCPSIDVLPTIRQVNFIERQMDALAETAAFPRILVPDSMMGNLDMRAGGFTAFDPNNASAVPKEWMTEGRYDIGQERVKTKQDAIRKAYHNDFFNMLAQQTQQMTAYETMQRVAEKLVLFSPTFARLTTEFLNPFLQRCFGICFRAGLFEDPPADVFVPDGKGVSLVAPQVVYTSKVALAIKALENHAFVDFMGIIGPLVNIRPEVLDNFDLDKIAVDIGRNLSLPTSWQVDEKDVAATRQARAQQQQQASAMQSAQGMAKAGADLGKAPKPMQDAAMAAFSAPLAPAAGAK